MKPNVKVRAGVSNVRDLRADLLSAAYDFREREQDTTLVLPDCRLSPERVADEWRLFAALLPDAASHVRLEDPRVGEAWGGGAGWAKAVDRQAMRMPAESARRAPGLGRFNVQNVLLLNWLDGLGPQTVKSIGAASGTSYPTTAAAIADLEAQGLLNVEKDRRVALKFFPVDLWRKWIVGGFAQRSSARFVDRSGQPRPPSSLIKRLQRLGRGDIAISGIEGARVHYPDLDLSGALRLDLVLHGSPKSDLEFVQTLDPALALLDNPYGKADLVVHFLDRPAAHFVPRDDLLIADPLACLADLYDMRLDEQADQMLTFLSERKKHA